MWDFPWYTSQKEAFSLSWGSLKVTRAEARAGVGVKAETGARASRPVLKIRCKLSSEYLGTSVAMTTMAAIEDFVSKSLAGYLKNSNSGSREDLEGVMVERF